MKTSFKRIHVYMPEYHNVPNFRGYSVSIAPVGKWRNIFRKWPYYVGDRISMKITFTPIPNLRPWNMNEIGVFFCHPDVFSGMPDTEIFNLKNNDGIGIVEKSSHILASSGVFKIYPGFSSGQRFPEADSALFSAEIIHKDRLMYDFFFVFIGFACALVGIIITFLLGFIQINPTWFVKMTP